MAKTTGLCELTGEQAGLYRTAIETALPGDLAALERLIRRRRLNTNHRRRTGLEVEGHSLIGTDPFHHSNRATLSSLSGRTITVELGGWQWEINVRPAWLDECALLSMETQLTGDITAIREVIRPQGADTMLIGIVPTMTADSLTMDKTTPDARYKLLNAGLWKDGAEVWFVIEGPGGQCQTVRVNTVAFEALNTSIQPHLQPASLEEFVLMYNRALVFLPLVMLLSANSPYVLGQEGWADNRTRVFQVATRHRAQHNRGYLIDPMDAFRPAGNTNQFPVIATLPLKPEDDPAAVGPNGIPTLQALKYQMGSVWWTELRAAIDTDPNDPAVRWEVRPIPAQPTVGGVIGITNLMFAGMLCPELDRVWQQTPSWLALRNLKTAMRFSTEADLVWPDRHGTLRAVNGCQLALDLWPILEEALLTANVSPSEVAQTAGVVLPRAENRQNGAIWQTGTVRRLTRSSLGQPEALVQMLTDYGRLSGNGLGLLDVGQWPRS